jgi:F420-non-reducing hydrogenase large subunit
MGKRVTIDPITRLEGHGKIEVFLSDEGNVERAYLQVPELRGFEKFAEGRLAEDMPQITSRICGVCPTAHHMAGTKALDDLYEVTPTSTARKIRELVYNTFMFEDHALHFYFLGGPDFVVGPDAPKASRNVLGVIAKVGVETGKKVIAMRKASRDLIATIAGKAIHPVLGLPGGVAKPLTPEIQQQARDVANQAVEFAEFSLEVFSDLVLSNKDYVAQILSPAYMHRTYYMGLVDENDHVNFYDGEIRIVDPDGREYVRFHPRDYLDHIAEHVEPWSYVKFCYLRHVGWRGFEEGADSGVYAVAPLARLNVAAGMPTPRAQSHYEQFYDRLGGKPVHSTLATHWARLIEMLSAAETMQRIAQDNELVSPDIRNIPSSVPDEGIGVVEAPRGTLLHHYQTDERGVITKANLIVATQNNAARIAMSVDRAAKGVIQNGHIDEGMLNKIEMAYRAYDPCHACATHTLNGPGPMEVRIRSRDGQVIRTIRLA